MLGDQRISNTGDHINTPCKRSTITDLHDQRRRVQRYRVPRTSPDERIDNVPATTTIILRCKKNTIQRENQAERYTTPNAAEIQHGNEYIRTISIHHGFTDNTSSSDTVNRCGNGVDMRRTHRQCSVVCVIRCENGVHNGKIPWHHEV